ncbi:Aminomethyltransferase, glycine cleavage system T protein [Nitrospira sp. KM1]|uniref:glycine cleavage system aminomethyltransferase GcvT n=1 Tax=Nitrospira sp. KM1 TaxID=1936990 RepID=UPI0013A753FC|nr:glycine cleavage system aminomethyltransferase GcvT [Nitrospira sp. KM1]BCA55445.1 Aminomethyltransferase, glycine cleavage system T protein [Nitrospira sp. KM1]
MLHTPLIEQHRQGGAKLVDFAGWEMPIQYTGVVDEYHSVRTHAGLFDVSHMGRVVVSGASSASYLQYVTTNNVTRLSVGQAHYSMICNDRGGIKDDVFVYRTNETEFLVCVNASNLRKIVDWMQQNRRQEDACTIDNRSTDLAQIALQGPTSRAILASLGAADIETLKLHHCCDSTVSGIPCFIARTGYTGELGYELNVVAEKASLLWNRLLEAGRGFGLKAAGLGARDLLRLEMAYLLYGNDMNEDITPLEAAAEWTVDLEKGTFIGRDALHRQKQTGTSRRFVAFELLEKGVPRHGFRILDPSSSHVIGEVTSGNLSPLLQKGIGLGYVEIAHTKPGTQVTIDIRGKLFPAHIVKPPFYQRLKAGPKTTSS